jgi:hypothetical protein
MKELSLIGLKKINTMMFKSVIVVAMVKSGMELGESIITTMTHEGSMAHTPIMADCANVIKESL